MAEISEGIKAFASFRALDDDGNASERDQLFRNMAQLFAYVSERCDDEQVAQYDTVLCQLAELVEAEARAHVAGILSKLDRAPGSVVVKLANDSIDVAGPLLEFSNVLSDDDLIEIVDAQSEEHRIAIAQREKLGERVGDAIVHKGGRDSVVTLVRNTRSSLGGGSLGALVERALKDTEIASGLRGREDIDWKTVGERISSAGGKVLEQLGLVETGSAGNALGTVSAMVYNRIRNKAGFNAQDWKLAWNQVKALADRGQLNEPALARFARFGYGHHAAAALTILLKITPADFVKWLATQHYLGVTMGCKSNGMSGELFTDLVAILPWRDFPSVEDLAGIRARYESLGDEQAREIFELWRAHAMRKRNVEEDDKLGVA